VKFSLFLFEQLLAILFFALTAAVCIQLFVSSHTVSAQSAELNHALVVVQNGAEAYKAASGDLDETVRALYDGSDFLAEDGQVSIDYDNEWQLCDEDSAAYTLDIWETGSSASGLRAATISVQAAGAETDADPIFQLDVVARGDLP